MKNDSFDGYSLVILKCKFRKKRYLSQLRRLLIENFLAVYLIEIFHRVGDLSKAANSIFVISNSLFGFYERS